MKITVLNEESFYGRTSYIVADGGRAICMVTVVNKDMSVAIIHDLVVHRSRRRIGIGGRLLARAEEVAWHMGADTMKLAVEPGTWMEGWYFRHGFNQTGTNVMDGYTCTVMEKNINRRETREP